MGALTLRKRRELGLTIRNVAEVLKAKDATELKQPTELLALDVVAELVKAHPQGWDDIDWDRVMEFIEKLIELILKILPFLV